MRTAFALAGAATIIVAAACGLDSEGGFDEPTETNPTTTGSAGAGNVGGSSSVATGGSSTTSTGGGGSSSSASGGGTPEDCLNGMDDDNDGATDCADSDCGAFVCVPEYVGATKYVSTVASANQCPTEAPSTDMRSCDGSCTCDGKGGTCSQSARYDGQSDCGNPNGTAVSSGCYEVTGTANRYFSNYSATHNGDAVCDPLNATETAAEQIGCAITSPGSCANAGEVCVPSVQTKTNSCVLLAGEVMCQAPYLTGTTVYEDTATTCNCSCGVRATSCPTPTVRRYGFSACGGSGTDYQLTNACHLVPNADSYRLPTLTGNVTCGADGTLATTSPAQTLCCM